MQNHTNSPADAETINAQPEAGFEKCLIFQVGSETYGAPLLQVQEIRTYTPATRIPNVPDYVLGVINLRGAIISVIDLRARFGLEESPEEHAIVIVVNINGKTFGLKVDSVSDVTEIDRSKIQPAPMLSGDQTQRFLSGLAHLGERVVILLDLYTILDLEALAQLAA